MPAVVIRPTEPKSANHNAPSDPTVIPSGHGTPWSADPAREAATADVIDPDDTIAIRTTARTAPRILNTICRLFAALLRGAELNPRAEYHRSDATRTSVNNGRQGICRTLSEVDWEFMLD
jgi:hypothetical protein